VNSYREISRGAEMVINEPEGFKVRKQMMRKGKCVLIRQKNLSNKFGIF
jgi:hypothetical protein